MSGKERQRRYRARLKAHGAGDHSLCAPERCEFLGELAGDRGSERCGDDGEGVTGDVTPAPKNQVAHRAPPAGLGERGLQLWTDMAGLKFGPAHVLLLERTCRMADRLARMDGLLDGGDWLTLAEVPGSGGNEVRVVVDRALSEIRQHDIALKLAVAELRQAGRPATTSSRIPETDQPRSDAEGSGAGANVRSIASVRNRVDAARG